MQKINIHRFICLTALLSLAFTAANAQAPGQKAASSLPNIVFILADDMGYGDVHCFNPQGKIPTPNIGKWHLGLNYWKNILQTGAVLKGPGSRMSGRLICGRISHKFHNHTVMSISHLN